jgi:ankyrin repeat protein
LNAPFRCDPPLHVVAQLGSVDVGECLLSNGADVNLLSAITGDTPLHRAICYDRSDFIRLLHAHAAEWHKPSRGGVAPLVLAHITRNAAALECCLDAGISSTADISSFDILRVMLAFPSVDAVTAAACSMLLLLWEQGAGQRSIAESLQLQWFGLLLVSSADAGSPSPIINVLSSTLVAICRRSGRFLLPHTPPPQSCH